MATLLHIKSSPRGSRSASIEVAESFITRYKQNHPDTELLELDLWEAGLPEFDQAALEAKYAGINGIALTETQQQAWDKLKALASLLYEANVIVLSIPLWNFGIPYKLKHFIDLVSQKDILFSFDPASGLEGLLHDKKAVTVYARGIPLTQEANVPAEKFDHQKPYIETWLNFIGITEIYPVIVDKTIFGPEIDLASRASASEEARQLADRV
ncbi:MAG TPA: NAD(P)H-dependent oxidoreductase [Methylophilaceae bacterium]|nr:NAD(P)H-dependent oxidoreductase [Methylophilaceae bacterium]